jgi:6,7-dimethyl-8-ribityllumazine synthase
MARTTSVRIGVVIGMFHRDMAEDMLGAAKSVASANGATIAEIYRIPGSMDAVLPCKWLMQREDIDAVVVLGVIEKGETLHGQVMGHEVTNHLLRLSLDFDKPLGFGIVGPGATIEQARVRATKHAEAAVRAALELRTLQSSRASRESRGRSL